MRIEVPAVEKVFDTIYKPYPIYVNRDEVIDDNKGLLEEFKQASEADRDTIYRDAIAIREYKEEFKDTFQTVEVYSKVRGDLLEQTIKYKTNPYTISKAKPSLKTPMSLKGGLEVGVPIINRGEVLFKPTIILSNTFIGDFSIGADTKGTVWMGYYFKL